MDVLLVPYRDWYQEYGTYMVYLEGCITDNPHERASRPRDRFGRVHGIIPAGAPFACLISDEELHHSARQWPQFGDGRGLGKPSLNTMYLWCANVDTRCALTLSLDVQDCLHVI
ncbi:uncharacterized protein LOC144552402 isoform X1 [Carex rostrata]